MDGRHNNCSRGSCICYYGFGCVSVGMVNQYISVNNMTKCTHPLENTTTVQVSTAEFSCVQILHVLCRIPWNTQSSLSAVANAEKTCLCVPWDFIWNTKHLNTVEIGYNTKLLIAKHFKTTWNDYEVFLKNLTKSPSSKLSVIYY